MECGKGGGGRSESEDGRSVGTEAGVAILFRGITEIWRWRLESCCPTRTHVKTVCGSLVEYTRPYIFKKRHAT